MNIINDKFTRDWIANQVHHWYGRYCWITKDTWNEMGSQLSLRDVLTVEDTMETLKETKDLPKTKDHRYQMYLDKIALWNNFKPFSKEHIFPFKFVDNGGHKKPSIGCNRLINQGYGILCIVDDMYERYSYGGYHGKSDPIPFEEKENKIHFLGSFTGPTESKTEGPWWSVYKTCRIEIVSKWIDAGDWIDVGMIDKAMPDRVKERADFESIIKPILKPKIAFEENFKNRFILCIEGNDVCSAFSWALASNCVPIHTYPFLSETLYFNGLKPYVHFIPIKKDASDLREAWLWCQENMDRCKQIAENGKEHMKMMQDKELCLKVESEVAKKWELKASNIKKA